MNYGELPTSWFEGRKEKLVQRAPAGITQWLMLEHWLYTENEWDLLEGLVFSKNEELFPEKVKGMRRQAYNWAYGTFQSRGHSSDGAELLAIIPFLDSLNHNPSAAGEFGDLAQAPLRRNGPDLPPTDVRLVTNRAYAAGDELHVAYDNVTKCHAQMLASYGFTDGRQERDCFHLHLETATLLSDEEQETAKDQAERGRGPIPEENDDYRNELLRSINGGSSRPVSTTPRNMPPECLLPSWRWGGHSFIAADGWTGNTILQAYNWLLREGDLPRDMIATVRLLLLPPPDGVSDELEDALSAEDFNPRHPIAGASAARLLHSNHARHSFYVVGSPVSLLASPRLLFVPTRCRLC